MDFPSTQVKSIRHHSHKITQITNAKIAAIKLAKTSKLNYNYKTDAESINSASVDLDLAWKK